MSHLELPNWASQRVTDLASKEPDLIAELKLYRTDAGGRKGPAPSGIGCPCVLERSSREANDAHMVFSSPWLAPGETSMTKFFFLFGSEVAEKFRTAGRFCLWEGKIIGEAKVVASTV